MVWDSDTDEGRESPLGEEGEVVCAQAQIQGPSPSTAVDYDDMRHQSVFEEALTGGVEVEEDVGEYFEDLTFVRANDTYFDCWYNRPDGE